MMIWSWRIWCFRHIFQDITYLLIQEFMQVDVRKSQYNIKTFCRKQESRSTFSTTWVEFNTWEFTVCSILCLHTFLARVSHHVVSSFVYSWLFLIILITLQKRIILAVVVEQLLHIKVNWYWLHNLANSILCPYIIYLHLTVSPLTSFLITLYLINFRRLKGFNVIFTWSD